MIKVLIGLGNPGPQFYYTRHSIGFRVVDTFAEQYSCVWHTNKDAERSLCVYDNQKIELIKPQTFMNSSGRVIPDLLKRGIKPEEICVVHDDLELDFGTVMFKTGGSAKGHNGLKSIIAACGQDFHRIRCGIGRPVDRQYVPEYVLHKFSES